MKKIYLLISCLVLTLIGNAQSLFKDLATGTYVSSNPDQFMNVNGTMYFITNVTPGYNHQLWKTDGTAANTVVVKDSIITTNVGGIITFINVNGTLFYALNKNGSSTSATITELWKTDGTTAGTVLVTTLTNGNPLGSTGDYPPQNYTVVGNKLFFQMGKGHGIELWVSDGTSAGTMEVTDLNPGNNGAGFNYPGVSGPMIGFNGKVYFQGNTTLGTNKLFSSDGTASGTTAVSSVPTPENFILYQNELYFAANSHAELWKTDGTSAGTVQIATTPFGNASIFKNALYYSSNGKLYKSDGTASGTALVKDSVGGITGILGNYFYTSFMKSLPAPPYYKMYYWKSDGTAAGTLRVSDSIGLSASWAVSNNKMYNGVAGSSTVASGLWATDGTVAGTTNLLASGTVGVPYVFNNGVFFSNFGTGIGYELWLYGTVSTTTGIVSKSLDPDGKLFPNPTTGKFKISGLTSQGEEETIKVLDLLGKKVYSESLSDFDNHVFDLSYLNNGIYLIQISSEAL